MIDDIMSLYKEKTKKECYKFEIEEGVTPDIMDDKIGGTPYLPIGEEIPLDKEGNPMVLLVQINLKNIELEDYPKEGILEIFIDRECSWPCDYKVKCFKEGLDYRKDLSNTSSENYIYEKPLKIRLIKDVEHMPLSDYRFSKVMSEAINEVTGLNISKFSEVENYFKENGIDMFEELYKVNIFAGNLSGYADFTQQDPRPIKGSEEKIECLIKIDSNIGHGVMIGDYGILFSFISKDDLKSGNFENAVVDWDCC